MDVITSRDPAAIVDDLERWNPGEVDTYCTEPSVSLVMPAGSQSRLIINENFRVEFVKPMPCRWHRLWYRLLLGWRWEAL